MATSQAPQQVPLKISVAPFPEGFEGDLDETFQQAVQLMEAYVEGNFLTGLILPAGSTLPTTDMGPIAMGGTWYFYDSVSGTYLPQSISAKVARNYAKNATYQIAQTGAGVFTIGAVDTNTYDMVLTRATVASVLAIAPDIGPPASGDSDNCLSAIKYTVGPALVPTLAATDRFVHEHLIEGTDIVMVQGETLTLSFSVYTNVPGVYSVYLTTGARDASFVANFTVQAANAWQRVRVSAIPVMPVGVIGTWDFGEGHTGLRIGVVFAVGSQFQTATANLNKWIGGAFYGTASNSNLCTVVNNQFRISAIKLEASPSATYCTVNSFEQDFHDATRYYWTGFNYQSLTAGTPISGSAPLNSNWLFDFLFPRRMCKAPLVVPYGYGSHVSGMISDVSTGADWPVANLAASPKGLFASGTIAKVQPTGNTQVNVPAITALSSMANLAVGMAISGSGIPAGSFITAIGGTFTKSLIGMTIGGSTVILGLDTTGLAAGMPITGYGVGGTITSLGGSASFIMAGLLTSGSATVSNLASTDGLSIGMAVTGSGIPASTTISNILSPTVVQLSAAATAAGPSALTFAGTLSASRSLVISAACAITAEENLTVTVTVPAASGVMISQPATASATGVALSADLVAKGDTMGAFVTADARLT